jgi:hypothetical protein
MDRLAHKGHLGDKTPMLGGFYRRVTPDGGGMGAPPAGRPTIEALDPASGNYRPLEPGLKVPFVDAVRALHRQGRYQQGIDLFMEAEGEHADIARRVLLGYVSYGLNRVGPDEVVETYTDIDRIMTAGFNWAPPSGLVDLIGVERTRKLLDQYGLPVPAVVDAAARGDLPTPLFNVPFVTVGRYFAG